MKVGGASHAREVQPHIRGYALISVALLRQQTYEVPLISPIYPNGDKTTAPILMYKKAKGIKVSLEDAIPHRLNNLRNYPRKKYTRDFCKNQLKYRLSLVL